MKKLFLITFLIIPIISNSQIITEGLVSYWPFNGNANDESGNGHNGVVFGSTLATDRFEKANCAYFFDGQDDYIDIGSGVNYANPSGTICLWFKYVELDKNRFLFSDRSSNNNYVQLLILANSGLNSRIVSSAENEITINNEISNNWHFVALSWGDTGMKVYLDMQLQEYNNYNGYWSSTSNMIIGASFAFLEENNFHGYIDDLVIFNRQLQITELEEIFTDTTNIASKWLTNKNDLYTHENVAIGTSLIQNGYKLTIDGKAIMEEVKVQLSENWPDFVFEKNYKLRTLEEVEQHIKENGRLPEIPSEAEVTETGINLGEMNAELLQKIEELTLYLIEQNKQNLEQQRFIEQLQNEVSALKNE